MAKHQVDMHFKFFLFCFCGFGKIAPAELARDLKKTQKKEMCLNRINLSKNWCYRKMLRESLKGRKANNIQIQ